MTVDQEVVPLPALSAEAKAMGWTKPPTYRRFYNLVLNGDLVATQENGRYKVRREHLLDLGIRLGGIPAPTPQKIAVR
jgi:hypothetical protein